VFLCKFVHFNVFNSIDDVGFSHKRLKPSTKVKNEVSPLISIMFSCIIHTIQKLFCIDVLLQFN
jgi:hypothetical protein